MKRLLTSLPALALLFFVCTAESCDNQSSDQVQTQQQETILKEGTNAVGMPAIKNFNERRLLKMILELRDQADLSTYTYTFSEVTGKLTLLCRSIGYGVPYATQYTNPQKIADHYNGGFAVTAQADPNGLYSPSSAEGTWVMCKDPNGGDVKPVYVEPRVTVSQFPLDK